MPVLAHETEAMNEDWKSGGKRVDQVGKVLPFYYADLFQPRYRVIPYPERLLLNPSEPMLKAEKIKRILFASVYQDDRAWRLQLSATPLSEHGNQWRRDGYGSQLPFQRRSNQRTTCLHCFPGTGFPFNRVTACHYYSVPALGRIANSSTVLLAGSTSAFTTAVATVSGANIFFRGASGQSVFQMSVSVAPAISAITRIPFGRNSSRKVFVNPRAPCLEAL